MKGKPVPTYALGDIQAKVRAGLYRITVSARASAAALGFAESDIVTCVLGLVPADFYKSMESDSQNGLWQDVYRPVYLQQPPYVKLQLAPSSAAVVISFKEL